MDRSIAQAAARLAVETRRRKSLVVIIDSSRFFDSIDFLIQVFTEIGLVHLEAVTGVTLQSIGKGVRPMLSIRPRLSKAHQPSQRLLSFEKDPRNDPRHSEHSDQAALQARSLEIHF